ncbi:MAG: ferrous iron transporter B [Candidatus Omnitrophica bacterium CG08_land_8_20_14_0_20_41_16]|uniref:Ferrous iron transporter B n=1 Tax=Candidatus Sherwoodlollariibacterium unditelluris TaxID=1974757 RepID=A0A2G9YK31_9BACT|nr:MAG: ferrous iron transporter B [Candidatus Omnitrophica bacterium CG23_combo_of_CG06-09_8_20_14_all_41_10]PIS33679.1 MAG: ferrous iron transporter B [Candidatus Omnitrophica bacterium CG08_land_8_20_14_0_20_41_16]
MKKIYLVGNPNVGKSVVFSRLTGVHVVSSNYPGTTIGFTEGYLQLGNSKIEVLDLPGVYSLEPASSAEEVAFSLLKQHPKDEIVVINIIDSTNLERNLLLTLQLIEEGFPLIACLNMCDDAGHRGIHIDYQKLEKLLDIPVIPTCAVTGIGIKLLIERMQEAAPKSRQRLIHEERWKEIGRIIEEVQHLEHRHHTLREMLEDASVRPLTGLLIAAGVIYTLFKVVRFIGESIISKITDPVFSNFYQPILEKLTLGWQEKSFWFHLLIGDLINGKIDFRQSLGILTTAPYIEFGMVLPYLISFYFILSLLEDIGYLPRLAILLDNLLHCLGLHGYAVIPLLLGFGCNVPGILSTRVLESKRERFIASTLISIGIPCVPLQAMIFGLLGKFGGPYVGGVYLVSFSLIIILGLILNWALKGYSPEFILEIPPYRLPLLTMLLKKLYFRIKGFLIEAVPVVLIGVLFVNILLYFKLFDFITGVFAPVITGLFGLPKEAVVSLAVGFLRKDVAVGMLMPLGLTAKQLFIAATLLAVSFPCVAIFVVLWKELGVKYLIKAILIMLLVSIIMGTLLNFVILR